MPTELFTRVAVGCLWATTLILSYGCAQNAAAQELSSAVEVLNATRERLDTYDSLRARIIEQVQVGSARYQAEGSYAQARGNRIRVELEVLSGNIPGSLLQVCDGDILWSTYHTGDVKRVVRRDVREILRVAKDRGPSVNNILISELGLGGLPAMLAAIQQFNDFEPLESVELKDKDFYHIKGRWKAGLVEEWTKPAGGTAPQAIHIPDFVEVFVEKEQMFPYRVRYWKIDPSSKQRFPLLTIDLRDIVVNSTINPADFAYVPADGVEVQNLTNWYLNRMQGNPGAQ
ncbi:LolA family protein [Calycomorphotria hydatis]|uniref:LolA family protein n=1 Tax=Calycomorphotria hydatis TaxID=2528027 RepID=UPI0011A18DC3|nr:hypothetical protein [Calycomorphotria hydatis]